jgi:iron complex transport system substrate-binding protein
MNRFNFVYKIQFVLVGFLFFISISSCIQHTSNSVEINEENIHHVLPKINHAKGFYFEETDSTILLKILYPSTNQVIDSVWLKHPQKEKELPSLTRTAIQSTTYFSFFDKLDALNRLIALCGVNYLSTSQKEKATHVQEICSPSSFNLEKLAVLQPDVLLLYPFEQKDVTRFHRLGIRTLLITEYLEETPLARAEWVKLFGLLTNNTTATTVFKDIETAYNEFKNSDVLGTVALNLPHGDNWNMPAGNSITANLVKDAGLEYVYAEQNQLGNNVLSMEEAYSVLSKVDYWIVIGEREADFSLEKLIAENKIYSTFPAVKNKKVIFCNTAHNDYFSKGVIEPHILLRDLIVCLKGGGVWVESSYFYVLE